MRGGSNCSVALCQNYYEKCKKSGAKVIFHVFPKNPQLRKEWIRRCHRKDAFTPQRICSDHFRSSDYEDEMQARLMGFKPKKLKEDAIPSLHLLPGSPRRSPKKSRRTERYQSRQNKFIVKDLTDDIDETRSVTAESVEPRSEEGDLESSPIPEGEKLDTQESSDVKHNLRLLEEENKKLKECIKLYENNDLSLKKKLNEMEEEVKKSKLSIEDQLNNVCKDFLSPNQVKLLLKKQSRVRWTQEDLSRAFTIRYLGKRCYNYMRNSLHYPLPAVSTLNRWAGSMNLRSGVLTDVINIMAITKKSKGSLWSTTILSFDEVKISSMYEYDQRADEIVGPHNYMQVVMARGLIEKWKQPVYIGFDQKLTKEILFDIITQLHNACYNVVSVVSDCEGGNVGLWNELSITIEKTYFSHPCSGKNVYVFADVPHLLKLLRNWFLDKGFILKCGKAINKSPVEALIHGNTTEISSHYKLKNLHIHCFGPQRQNVALAAQLFSNTTATALKRYLPGSDPTLAKDVGEFILLVNNWFDVMNSYTLYPSVPTKQPYGVSLKYQNEVLATMMETVQGMRCTGKHVLQTFQKGIVMSIKSLQALFDDLKGTTSIEYILTHRLNQDCLENFFSQIRSRGGLNDHPSPLNALYRVRMILLGKNPGIVQVHANIAGDGEQEAEKEEFLVATALKQARLDNVLLNESEPSLNLGPECNDSDTASSSSTSTSTSSGNEASSTPISEKDGMNYLAGYLAKKYLKEFPYLGRYTKDMEPVGFHTYSLPSWVQSLSFGGLIEPSQKWLAEFEVLNKYFQKLHKQNFNGSKHVHGNTYVYITKKVAKYNIQECLIKAFVRQRIFIRIKYLNQRLQEKKIKRKATADHKIVKKMKKIIN